ncbi:MAG: hypothetical protein ACRC92_20440 [Peptostreptococcaceae bacterium]
MTTNFKTFTTNLKKDVVINTNHIIKCCIYSDTYTILVLINNDTEIVEGSLSEVRAYINSNSIEM